MYSIGILSAVLFAFIATTNALECRPVMCMIACPFGFALDAQGCPHCSCRTTPNVCIEPIFGYNCGSFDHRDCPSSHECQLSFGGFSGQCCLKHVSSTTARSTSTTARPTSTTARSTSTTARATTRASGTSTRRSLNRLLVRSADSTTGAPGSTTQGSGTTQRAGASTTGSQFWSNFNLEQWMGVGAK
jgi:hypothetical protein